MYRLIHLSWIVLLALLLAACGTAQSPDVAAGNHAHGSVSHTEHNDAALDAAPYDAQFIDSMTIHHQGAIAMAQQALTNSERPEIKQLAQQIIAAQDQEIKQLAEWRQQWYADLPATSGTGEHLGDMELADDPGLPFDQRFIAAMISHHQGAIAMAKTAQAEAQHDDIKQLAQQIIAAQEAEVKQLQFWQSAWFSQ